MDIMLYPHDAFSSTTTPPEDLVAALQEKLGMRRFIPPADEILSSSVSTNENDGVESKRKSNKEVYCQLVDWPLTNLPYTTIRVDLFIMGYTPALKETEPQDKRRIC